MSEEVQHMRDDIRSMRQELRELTSAVSKATQQAETGLARVTVLVEQHGKQITELWAHVNRLDDEAAQLAGRMQAVEQSGSSLLKLAGLAAAVAAAVAALAGLLK
jgi:prefoldin subunit 5